MEENAELSTSEQDTPTSAMDAERDDNGTRSEVDGGDSQDTERGEQSEGEDVVLSTDRIGLEALEDLFTERTDDGDELEPGSEQIIPRTDDDEAAKEETEENEINLPQEATTISERDEAEPRKELATPSISRSASPPVGTPPPQRSPSRPIVPARPPRSGISTPNTPAQLVSYHNNNSSGPCDSSSSVQLQLVSFDVGGRLFRCKAALVRKFPEKRLFHVMTCGCEQIARDMFFIDRNPQHFEIILDWYRTGKPLRSLPPHVNEDALKEDAKYFDLYDELFPVVPVAPPIPSRIKSPPPPATPATALPKLPERPSRQPTPLATTNTITAPVSRATESTKPKADKRRAPTGVCRFTKSKTRWVPPVNGGLPVWFTVRSHEHLVVESVKGSGKLLVRVTDPTGMARVFVDQAVLFDSRSWFYLQEDGRAKLQNCVLPGNHVYTFWTEPIHEQLPSPPPQTLKAKAAEKAPKVKNPVDVTPPPPEKPDLEVEFKLIATFSATEEMEENAELGSLLQAKGKGWSEDPAASVQQSTGINGPPVCLFLPPREEAAPKEPGKPIEDAINLVERDAIAEQIRAVAAKDRNAKSGSVPVQPAALQQEIKSPGNPLKRNGAAIAQSQPQKNSANKHGEKIMVYQPMEPLLASASSPRAQYNAQQPRRF